MKWLTFLIAAVLALLSTGTAEAGGLGLRRPAVILPVRSRAVAFVDVAPPVAFFRARPALAVVDAYRPPVVLGFRARPALAVVDDYAPAALVLPVRSRVCAQALLGY